MLTDAEQVETLLETRDTSDLPQNVNQSATSENSTMPANFPSNQSENLMQGVMTDPSFNDPTLNIMTDFGMSSSDDFSWEMIGLGLEEALPNPDVMQELYLLPSFYLRLNLLMLIELIYILRKSIHLSQ